MVDQPIDREFPSGIREDESALLERKAEGTPQFVGPESAWLSPGTGPVIADDSNFCKHLSDSSLTNDQDHCSNYTSSSDCGTPTDPAVYTEGTAAAGGEYTLCEWREPDTTQDAGHACTIQAGRKFTFSSLPDGCLTRLEEARDPNETATPPSYYAGSNYTAERCRTECGESATCKYWQYVHGICEHYCASASSASFAVTIDHLGYSSGECAPTAGACLDGSTHKCPWTVHMKQLKSSNLNQAHSCHSRLLEARRTLDGLLQAVNTTYHEMMVENDRIKVANTTIEAALADHDAAATKLLTDRQQCEYNALAQNQSLVFLEADILELQSIASPTRSTISETTDYVQDTINRSVNEDTRVHDQYASIKNGSALDIESFTKAVVDNVARTLDLTGGGADVTTGTKTAQGFSGGFIELSADSEASQGALARAGVLDAGTCGQMTSLLERSVVRASRQPTTAQTCVDQRTALTSNFNAAWDNLTALYDRINFEIGYNRTYCLKNASWVYNHTILGPSGVDDRISNASQAIHIAQQTIMVLLPRLHDLEHAVTQMRTHITNLNDTCRVDARVTVHLQTIQQLIHDMQECPGRNNFTLTIPKWQANRVATPPPTPYGRMPGLPTSGHHVQQATLHDYEFGAARRRGDTFHDAQRNDWSQTYQGRTYTYSEDGTVDGAGKGTVTDSIA